LQEYIASISRIQEQVKQETNMKQAAIPGSSTYYLLHAVLLLGVLLNPEYGGDMFLRNVG
jgi:hypothetical protein